MKCDIKKTSSFEENKKFVREYIEEHTDLEITEIFLNKVTNNFLERQEIIGDEIYEDKNELRDHLYWALMDCLNDIIENMKE